jgi:hypothetical protein
MAQLFLIGIAAGAASALLYASPQSGNPLALVLALLAALPMMMVGLIWNHRLTLLALVTGTIAFALAFGSYRALGYFISIGVPSYVLVYLAMLGRPVENGIEWYPPGRIVSWAAVLGAALVAVVVVTVGTDLQSYRTGFRAYFENDVKGLTPQLIEQQVKALGLKSADDFFNLFATLVPPISAVISMISNLFSLWLAGLLARGWGRLQRPWPDLPAMTFPAATSIMFAVSLVIAFAVPGLIGLISTIFVAVFTIAHSLLGFATLHTVTQGVFGRPLLLAIAWLSMLIAWPLLFPAMLGIVDQIFNLRGRFAAKRPPVPPRQSR